MKIDILTLFPNIIEGFLSESIIKRAIEKGKVQITLINFREYSPLNNGQVDDTMYGGGPGMLLRPEPIFECLDKIKTKDSKVIMLTPDGKTFNQAMANKLKDESHLIIICGRYEGFDERIKTLVDEEISIGDFVLTGGEVPAMVLCDTIIRLIPDVINQESLLNESFNNDALDYPAYTKPAVYRDLKVPDVLLSGNHQEIKKWREEMARRKTEEKRPDLRSE